MGGEGRLALKCGGDFSGWHGVSPGSLGVGCRGSVGDGLFGLLGVASSLLGEGEAVFFEVVVEAGGEGGEGEGGSEFSQAEVRGVVEVHLFEAGEDVVGAEFSLVGVGGEHGAAVLGVLGDGGDGAAFFVAHGEVALDVGEGGGEVLDGEEAHGGFSWVRGGVFFGGEVFSPPCGFYSRAWGGSVSTRLVEGV